MPNKFARSNGDFNNPSIWSLLAGSMSATTVPTIGDNAIANTFTIQITGNVACDNIHTSTVYGGSNGGSFNVDTTSGSVNLSASILGGYTGTSSTATVRANGSNSLNIYGNITQITGGSKGNLTISLSSILAGSLNIYGDVSGPLATTTIGGYAIQSSGSGPINLYGNVIGGNIVGGSGAPAMILSSPNTVTVYGNIAGGTGKSADFGISNTSTGSVTVYGNLNALAANAVSNTSTGSVTVYGNLNPTSVACINNTSTGSVTVLGNVTGDSRGGAGITSTNAAANVRISGNLIGAPNGIPAVYAAAYTVNPIPSQTYIRYANNGTGVGSDAYLYHYTTDSLSAFSMPPVSAVRAGVQYADNTLTGTCEIPPVSSVTFGTLVDKTTGTAILTSNNLWETPIASLTATNSVGARLRNSATVESVGRILASFTN
jgi:hypothetical protein